MPSIEIAGDDLLSVAAADVQTAQAIAARLRETGAWLEVVPGIDSVVVQFDALTRDSNEAIRDLGRLLEGGVADIEFPDTLVEISVVYGGEFGPDLAGVCEVLGITPDEFIGMHTSKQYRVELVGFTPGFVYVGGLDERLHIARRNEPRQHVPAGSVGIADGRTGLYALQSPGGWQIVGRTMQTLFDPAGDDPFPLRAGMRVKFLAIDAPEAGR
ncbi:MAG: 5-oxoprolinase subunit PxpB [Woeseiaceae bacterium]